MPIGDVATQGITNLNKEDTKDIVFKRKYLQYESIFL